MVGWIAFSVVYGVIGGFTGSVPTEGWFFIYLFGLIFFFSLPVAVIAEIVRWRKRKSKPASV
jgi:membrane protein DedA with SNARE-associated domain